MKVTAQKIRKYRELLDYSQEYVAGQLGISQPAYAKIENGVTHLTLIRLLELSEILQIDPSEFLAGNKHTNFYATKTSPDLTEKLYRDNREIQQKLMERLQGENQRLLLENERLWKIIQSEKRI